MNLSAARSSKNTASIKLSGLFVLLLILLANPAWSDDCDSNQQTHCISQSKWQLGIAIGLGTRTNPLVDGDNIPLIVQLDVAYYSQYAYFDNGELGIKWYGDSQYDISSYISFDRERANFSFWNPSNIFIPLSSALVEPGTDSNQDQVNVISSKDISTRKWALMLGNKINYYVNNHRWSVTLEKEISGVHQGFRINASYQHLWQGDKWRLQIQTSINYIDDKLSNYYYGIDEQDSNTNNILYVSNGGLQPKLGLLYTYQLSKNWQFITSMSSQLLHKGMRNSPIVDTSTISSVFIGAGYRF